MTVDWQFILAIHVYPYFLQIDLLWDFSLPGIHLSKFIFPFGYVPSNKFVGTCPEVSIMFSLEKKKSRFFVRDVDTILTRRLQFPASFSYVLCYHRPHPY
jgi:hypothetical protein